MQQLYCITAPQAQQPTNKKKFQDKCDIAYILHICTQSVLCKKPTYIEAKALLHKKQCLRFYDIKPLSTRNHHSKSVEFEPNSYRFVNIFENVPQFSNSHRFFTGGVNHKHASAESGIRLSNTTEKLKFHSASPREISNFSVVFEPNSKFHSLQKDVYSTIFSVSNNFFQFSFSFSQHLHLHLPTMQMELLSAEKDEFL